MGKIDKKNIMVVDHSRLKFRSERKWRSICTTFIKKKMNKDEEDKEKFKIKKKCFYRGLNIIISHENLLFWGNYNGDLSCLVSETNPHI